MVIGSCKLKIGRWGGLLRVWWWTLGFHERRGIDWPAGILIRLSKRAPHEGGISMVNWATSLFMSLPRAVQDVPGGWVNTVGGHSMGDSKQMCICTCVLFRTVSQVELFHCTVHCTLYTVQTSNTPCPHTSCKVHWCWRRNFRKCIILGKLYQLCHLNNKYRY
jgi:hypothetical protein